MIISHRHALLKKSASNIHNDKLNKSVLQKPHNKKKNLSSKELTNSSSLKKRMVRATGLEPARIAPPDPKSGASANSATPAYPQSTVSKRAARVKC